MCKLLFLLAVRLHLPCQSVKTEVLLSSKESSGLLLAMLWCHSLGMTLVIPTHPELCHNLMWSHFYISKTACEGHFSRREQLVLVFNSSLCFWRSFGKRGIPEGGCVNTSLPAPSKLCCPAQSDKEATGTASSVWSLINRLIRLILQFFDGGMRFICSTHHFFYSIEPGLYLLIAS